MKQFSWASRVAFLIAALGLWNLGCLPTRLNAQAPELVGEPLKLEGDIAAQMVDGVDRFLLSELQKSIAGRARFWHRDVSSPEAFARSNQPQRDRLMHLIGMRDQRIKLTELELVTTTARSNLVAQTNSYRIHQVRWPTFAGVYGEGLLIEPIASAKANVVLLPDADQTPEMWCGLSAGLFKSDQLGRRLAEAGCRVVIPTLIDRTLEARNGRAKLSSREYIYRAAYELGRHLIGYEVHKSLAVIDWFKSLPGESTPTAIVGYGEGGMLALYAAAVDARIDCALISGCFAPREGIWQEPVDRNVFGLLEQFGAAELAAMVAPRRLLIQASPWPQVTLPSQGGAPGSLVTPDLEVVKREFARGLALLETADGSPKLASALQLFEPAVEPTQLISSAAGDELAKQLFAGIPANAAGLPDGEAPQAVALPDAVARQKRQLEQLSTLNQQLLANCDRERQQFMNIGLTQYDQKDDGNKDASDKNASNRIDTSNVEAYTKSLERFRNYFRDEIVGRFDYELLPASPRIRKTYDTPKWIGYEVTLDVLPDVFAYGILCIPKDLPAGSRRPVVVCQHGLEGRPQDVVTGDHQAYHDFAGKLAELGFVTFAPQNLYIGQDRFRTLQRKAYPLKKTLFSVIVPQHQQIVRWLAGLPFVDGDRIGFYGLSYGGKSAMRIPPLVDGYCLSICSADFNDWVWKNASTSSNYSYMWTGEYEIFEFDLGTKFNYAEMAALIAPRPFMVERGHFDGVAPDDRVAAEFAKVRHLYSARLGLGDRCELEWFVGPHTIHGVGTFEFLKRHLRWPMEKP